ncbi:MAG: hypothetical protein Q7R48_03895 [bacterium]|nr:hypothetical protein [bacterium]
MIARIQEEIELLRARFPNLVFKEEGYWVRLPEIEISAPWAPNLIEIAFQFPPAGYPQNPFYGFFVPSGLLLNGATPQNFTDPAASPPPFDDVAWAFFSGNPDPWDPRPAVHAGSNVVTWVQSIFDRFREHV